MADTQNPDVPNAAAPGSILGKYHTTITLYDYERENPFSSGPDANDKVSGGLIILPLPVQLYDRTSSAFSQQNLGVIGDIFNLDVIGGAAAAPLRLLDSFGSTALNTIINSKTFAARQRAMRNSEINVGASLASALGNKIDVSAITTSVEQLLGVTPNPNPVVTFKGPQLRVFNYSWYLSPKNEAESKNIKDIIHKLKSASLPGRALSSNALLKMPKLAQMNFYPWDKGGLENKWGWNEETSIIKMKRCHISNVSANYNPANVPAFFKDNLPVIIELSIELLEVEYMFSEDWHKFESDKDQFNPRDYSDLLDLGSLGLSELLGSNT